MAAALSSAANASAVSTPWLVALMGVAAMYGPSYWAAAHGLWQTDEFGHAPIVFVVFAWLLWQLRQQIRDAPNEPLPAWGWPLLLAGISLYGLGRTLGVSSIEFVSQPLVVAALFLLLKGVASLRVAWFAVFYLVFMVPLPATVVDAVTGPLKQWISFIVVDLLYASGYPIARSGVMITIGQYQLLVADACSGLNSMVSLSALGTLFVFIADRGSRAHTAVMLFAILPIAFCANIVRVVALVLVTYYLGDEAGQGFLHGAAGIVLMMVALRFFFALNAFLVRALPTMPRDRARVPS